nr:hypothetical protein HmN_000154400 [Hymenolepis microstoma]
MFALSATDATTLIITFPLGFQRCKGFLEVCPKPWFKTLRLWISYYTTYVHFPISNSSETASIFLTLFLSLERALPSVEACQVKEQRKSREINFSATEAVSPTGTNKMHTTSDSRSYADHVWRVSIRVSIEERGRAVTLASAASERTVCATHSSSISSPGPNRSPSESFSSKFKFPANDFLFASEPLCLNSISKPSGFSN